MLLRLLRLERRPALRLRSVRNALARDFCRYDRSEANAHKEVFARRDLTGCNHHRLALGGYLREVYTATITRDFFKYLATSRNVTRADLR